eukprot:GHUV01008849.1.p1 GENE.GHUV01008849.1~~GHUV01008849.1.p1  ORF type:complete len:458 (+),score=60.20 GHUV01008849.1:208-1581(+)
MLGALSWLLQAPERLLRPSTRREGLHAAMSDCRRFVFLGWTMYETGTAQWELCDLSCPVTLIAERSIDAIKQRTFSRAERTQGLSHFNMSKNMCSAFFVAILAVACLVPGVVGDAQISFGMTYSGDGTYYGDRTRGFGHCSFHFHGFGNSAGYVGTPLAINAAQYSGTSICGLCVQYRGVGQGLGGNPVSTAWQPGFICDECPECRFGDLDQQMGGDGRWKVEWYPMQCPVGSTTFKFGFQGGNPWYKKMMVANARVPLSNVRLWQDGAWVQLIKTIDNYWEYHGDTNRAWNPCAKIEVTSILGDKVTDTVCCSSGTCEGKAQFPCRGDLPSSDCASKGPGKINVGGIGRAGDGYNNNQQKPTPKQTVAGAITGTAATVTASYSMQAGGGRDMATARVASNKSAVKILQKGEQCGGTGFNCANFGDGACQDKKFAKVYCAKGLKCKRNDAKWWGCSQ